MAAASVNLELLQCARSNRCVWDAPTSAAAAGSVNLLMLQWASDNGCPWDSLTCMQAAYYGRMAVL
jgi:hypothetical protein